MLQILYLAGLVHTAKRFHFFAPVITTNMVMAHRLH